MIAGSRFFARPALGRDGYSFDNPISNHNQLELLFDFLSNAPRDVGIIVTKYVEWGPFLPSCGPSAIACRKPCSAMAAGYRTILSGALRPRGANDPMDAFVPIDVLEQAWIRKALAPMALATPWPARMPSSRNSLTLSCNRPAGP